MTRKVESEQLKSWEEILGGKGMQRGKPWLQNHVCTETPVSAGENSSRELTEYSKEFSSCPLWGDRVGRLNPGKLAATRKRINTLQRNKTESMLFMTYYYVWNSIKITRYMRKWANWPKLKQKSSKKKSPPDDLDAAISGQNLKATITKVLRDLKYSH